MPHNTTSIGIIRSEEQYTEYLERMNQIFFAEPGTPEFEELELLGLVLDKYESEHYPIEPPSPLEAIKFAMEQRGMDDAELGGILKSRSRVSEIFKGRRKLSLDHIRAINKSLGVPAEILIQDYNLK